MIILYLMTTSFQVATRVTYVGPQAHAPLNRHAKVDTETRCGWFLWVQLKTYSGQLFWGRKFTCIYTKFLRNHIRTPILVAQAFKYFAPSSISAMLCEKYLKRVGKWLISYEPTRFYLTYVYDEIRRDIQYFKSPLTCINCGCSALVPVFISQRKSNGWSNCNELCF